MVHALCVLVTMRLHTHTQNMLAQKLLIHGNNGYANEPPCYVCTHTACFFNALMHSLLTKC